MHFFLKYLVTLFYKKLKIKIVVICFVNPAQGPLILRGTQIMVNIFLNNNVMINVGLNHHFCKCTKEHSIAKGSEN